jgi:hypothetical protein
MRARRTLISLGLVLVLFLGGLVVASNMGFKWAPTWSVVNTDYWISLPYRGTWSTAQDLCDLVPNSTLVSRFDPSASVRTDWTCPFGNNFGLTPGEGLFIRVSASSSPVFVGSHDDELTIPAGGFTVTATDYFLAIPYHTTAAVADDICTEIADATVVSRFDTGTGVRADWTCPFGDNFTVNPGESLAVRVSQPGPGFVPSHY